MRPGAAGTLALAATMALGAGGCGNQLAASQTPAPVSGTVTSRPPCQPRHACSFLVALVPGAFVVASGKDGSHETHADAHGHFRLYLLEGVWTLHAARTGSSALGPGVTIDVGAGQARTVALSVAP